VQPGTSYCGSSAFQFPFCFLSFYCEAARKSLGDLVTSRIQLPGFETSGFYEIYMQNLDAMALVLSCIGTLCWIVCFWWMHRISSRQDTTLEELHEMTARIEKLSRAEHDLIRDVHPQVSEIKEKVENVREAVSSERS
jgi:hypothetical protein